MRTVSDSHICTIRNGLGIGKIDSPKKYVALRARYAPHDVGAIVRMVTRRISEEPTAIPRSRVGLPLNEQAHTLQVWILQSAARLSTRVEFLLPFPRYSGEKGWG